MPRAHRTILLGYVWHITHRCHKQEFLLKFVRDRQRWLHWLFVAKRRYGLTVVNYIVTSNHIHLLVHDNGNGEIAKSMQLIAGRTAQEYNQRKNRKGAFWEDRYHATAVDTEDYLYRCLVYIDMNMVRAGVVNQPKGWKQSGYNEIQSPPNRYRIINSDMLSQLCGFSDVARLREVHKGWIEQALNEGNNNYDDKWTKSVAVGKRSFIELFQNQMGYSGLKKRVTETGGDFFIREPTISYRGGFKG